MLTPKTYQQNTLDTLRDYLRLAIVDGAKRAFINIAERPYHAVEQVPDAPYICLRVPTGGGKTLMACHAVGIVTQEYLRQEHSVVLWLVPTNTIREQTIDALRNRLHPYRQALDGALNQQVAIMDLTEALFVRRAILDSQTVIIVSTLAALRVEDTDGRRVYDQNGALMPCLDGLPDPIVATLERYQNGSPVPSLANVLKTRRPMIIMDEAHNARTELSFDTLARFSPSCIIEFTATPVRPPLPNSSNVLCHVSAYELKAEHMIKLPIELETNGDWRTTIAAAMTKRAALEDLAQRERAMTGEYVRPIVLLQAQPRRQRGESLTVEVVKGCLLELGIPPEQIAIETGESREVKKWEDDNRKTLFDETCPIRFIITVQALREGWDCAFAYILCSVAESGSATAVEQIIGRVLRMPKAVRKQHDDLNHAYAYVTSYRFTDAAQAVEGLAMALEANGFSRFEANAEIVAQLSLGIESTPLFRPADIALQTPAERGALLEVPQLALAIDDALVTVEQDLFLPPTWELSKCDAMLTEEEFSTRATTSLTAEIDVNRKGVVERHVAYTLHPQLALWVPSPVTTADELVLWLDRSIPHRGIDLVDMQTYLLRLAQGLTLTRGMSLDQLSSERYRLRDAAMLKIRRHQEAAMKVGFQQALFADNAPVVVSAERVFTFNPNYYPANTTTDVVFRKHYYRAVGAMNDEELRCAQFIDTLPQVKYWVRNLERREDFSFWLPTSSDKFYPDFLMLLNDDRVVAAEYKGGFLLTGDDTKEKLAVGRLWEARSKGRCAFLLLTVNDFEPRLRACVGIQSAS